MVLSLFLFIGVDGSALFEAKADVIQPVEQAMFAEGVDLKLNHLPPSGPRISWDTADQSVMVALEPRSASSISSFN